MTQRKGRAAAVLLKQVKFNSAGLVPAVIQDAKSKEVLMVAYMNRKALAKTLETGKTHFYSRSRKKLWLKGESSGHTQAVKRVSLDCDADTLLVEVAQTGGACHTGFRSCFFRKADKTGKHLKTTGKRLFNPKVVYGK